MALLAGCQPLILPVTPTVEADGPNAITSEATPLPATKTLSDTVAIPESVAITESVTISRNEPVSATTEESPTAALSATVTTAVTTTVSTTVTTATNAEQNTTPLLTVIVASLRLRSGPGTEYTVIGAAAQGEQYPLVGQANNCQWYQVTHPQLGEVWLSGGDQYVTTAARCDQLPTVVAPALLAAEPTATPAPAQEASNPTPAPTAPPVPSAADPFPADQGCLLLQNQLGPELTFTFTSADGSWNDIVKVGSEQDVPYCFTPGRYRVTVDAPPPWADLNEEFSIQAGDRAYFPIRPQ